jgi:hypothetical protein
MSKAGAAAMTLLALAIIGFARPPRAAGQATPHQHDHEHAGAIEAMGHGSHATDPHIKLSTTRPLVPADRERADAIVQTLRRVLEPYRDSEHAERDGYRPFLETLPLPQYHFTNWGYGFLGAFSFDPERPTSLLYRRTGRNYALAGAMYTAPARATEQQLDERIPLSVARWHMHVNICLPPKGARNPDWTRFGFKGTIASKAECDAADGRFHSQIFGWMVHVHPFEQDPERIWMH